MKPPASHHELPAVFLAFGYGETARQSLELHGVEIGAEHVSEVLWRVQTMKHA